MAQDWFTRQLLESPEAATARAYLEGGRDPAGDRQSTGLGYAPRDGLRRRR